MAGLIHKQDRTLAFAETALEQIRALGNSGVPRNFEIWYVYASGQNAQLNAVINETLARNGLLTDVDLERIYDKHLAETRTADKIEQVGTRVVGEIDDVVTILTDALGMTASFGESLAGTTSTLSAARDRDQIKAVVETLVTSVRGIERTNKALEERLRTSRAEITALQQNLEMIRAENLTDQLTGLGNRKCFDRTIASTVRHGLDNGEALSLLMIDIDHFKLFNDKHGHLTGDQVMRLVGALLKQSVSDQDAATRFGGEEFAIILPNTPIERALKLAEQIRCGVMARELKKKSTGDILGRITVSIGVAVLHADDDVDSLIDRADQCLYAAKHAGRNRVVSEMTDIAKPQSKVA